MTKRIYLILSLAIFSLATMTAAIVAPVEAAATTIDPAMSEAFTGTDKTFSPEDFLALTPKKIRATTGRKLKFKEVIGLKLAQKQVKKQMRQAKKAGEPPVSKGLFILCAILLPIAAVIFMGVMDDWEGNNWWIALILYALCYIPGLIYTLTKVKDYY